MIFVFIILLLIFLIFILYCAIKIITFIHGAPYAQSSDKRTKIIIEMLNPKKGEKIVDLGSGDGKLLFEIAKKGAQAYGYGINPILVYRTKMKAKKLGLEKLIHVEQADFFKKDLSKFDSVIVYGITYIMERLEEKLVKELKPETKIISNYFKLPKLKPIKKVGEVLLYKA